MRLIFTFLNFTKIENRPAREMYHLTATEQMAMVMQSQVPDGKINWSAADWQPLMVLLSCTRGGLLDGLVPTKNEKHYFCVRII